MKFSSDTLLGLANTSSCTFFNCSNFFEVVSIVSDNTSCFCAKSSVLLGSNFNNEFIPNNPEYLWIKEVSSKSIKRSLENANNAFSKFFNHKSSFPRFKKKGK